MAVPAYFDTQGDSFLRCPGDADENGRVCNPELFVFFLKGGVADFSQIIAHGVPFDLNITRTAIESCRRAWTGDANRRWRGLLNLSEF